MSFKETFEPLCVCVFVCFLCTCVCARTQRAVPTRTVSAMRTASVRATPASTDTVKVQEYNDFDKSLF